MGWTMRQPRPTDDTVRRHASAPLALVLIVSVLSALWPFAVVTPLSSYDQRFYLGIAYDLRHSGRFSDGFSYAGGNADTARPSGMRFTPLYPAFLAAMAAIDPGLRAGMDCVAHTAGRDPSCPRSARLTRGAQFLMLVAFYWVLWAAAGCVTASRRTGWIALALGLMPAPLLLQSVNTLMTETVSLLLSAAACALGARAAMLPAASGRARIWWLGCGAACGLAALSRPVFLYPLWAGLGCGMIAAIRARSMRRFPALAGLACGAALVLLPWIARNAVVMHRAALSFGYASHTLIQRIAFDAMTPREYGLSFICWLPDGSGLGKLIAGPHACDRFGWEEHSDSFYAIGTGPLMRQSLAASGGWTHHMPYIMRHYVLAAPLTHLLVSIPLALRGLYIDHYWGLVLAPVSAVVTIRAVRRRQYGVLLLSAPAWFLLGFNALVAVNQPRYNLLLVLPFSLAGAIGIERLLRLRDQSFQRHHIA